jgi:hypothetical protein
MKIPPVGTEMFHADGRTDGQTDRRTDRQTDGRTDGRTDGQTDGRTDRRTDGQTDRQTDRHNEAHSRSSQFCKRVLKTRHSFTTTNMAQSLDPQINIGNRQVIIRHDFYLLSFTFHPQSIFP